MTTCTYVATNGHLEVLQWMREQDPPCPWDKGTCAAAAMQGHLDVEEEEEEEDEDDSDSYEDD